MHVASRGVRPGDRVFVIGAGPIGVLMARAALLFGAADVHITDPVAERLRARRGAGRDRRWPATTRPTPSARSPAAAGRTW